MGSVIGRTLFGQTRSGVLGLLLGRPDERFYLREIVRAVGGGTGAVQRELKQLVHAGLIDRKAEGRQVYFSANRRAPVFHELQSIVQKTTGVAEVLRASLAPLLRKEKISLALIYGSVATGEQTALSDVDLLLVGDVTLAEIIPAVRVAEKKLGREVNPSIYPAQEFRDKLGQGAPFLQRIMNGPRLFIAGDDDVLTRLAR